MKINIKESNLIKPEKETPNHNLWLSNLDLMYGIKSQVPLAFFYKPNDSFEIGRLKEALSKVLVPFYPMAGRFGRDENGRLEINCNGEGVLFVEAETDSSFEELDQMEIVSPALRQLLIPTIDYSNDLSAIPFLVLQVTKFSCGGVSIGIGRSHIVTDGVGGFNFINSWATIARGGAIDNPPHIDRSILRSGLPPSPKFYHDEYDSPPTMKSPNQSVEDVSNCDTISVETFNITRDQINSMKSKTQNNYSTYKILTAHIWRCFCKARELSNDQESKLFMAVDGRSRFNPPLPQNYFGNVTFKATPMALSGDILSESVIDTIERVDKAIKKMDDEYLRSAIDYLEHIGDMSSIVIMPSATVCPNPTVISWTQMPYFDVDFGWGKPVKLKGGTPWESRAFLWLNGDGSLSLSIGLNVHHMPSFVKLFNADLATY